MSLDKNKSGVPLNSRGAPVYGGAETAALLDIPSVTAGAFPIKLHPESLSSPVHSSLRSFVSKAVEHDVSTNNETTDFSHRNMIVLPTSFLETHKHICNYFGRFMTCIDGRKFMMEDYFAQNGFTEEQINGFTSKLDKIVKYRGFGTLGGGRGAIGDMLKAVYDLLDTTTKNSMEQDTAAQEAFVMNMITYFSPELADILRNRIGEHKEEDNFKHSIYSKILTKPQGEILEEGGAIVDYLQSNRKKELDYIRVNFHNGKHGTEDHDDHTSTDCFEGCGYLKEALNSDLIGLPDRMRTCLHEKITLCDDVYSEINEIIQEIKLSTQAQLSVFPDQKNDDKINFYTNMLQDCQLIRRMPESFDGEHVERAIFVLKPAAKQLDDIFQDINFIDTLPLPTMSRQIEVDGKGVQYFVLDLTFQLRAARQIWYKFDFSTQKAIPRSVFAKKVYEDNIQHLEAVGKNLYVNTGLSDGKQKIAAAALPIVLLEGEFILDESRHPTYLVTANMYNEGKYDLICNDPTWFT